VVFVEFTFAAQDLGDDARRDEDVREIHLKQALLVQEELEDLERLGRRERIAAGLEILYQQGQEPGEFLSRGGQVAALVQFIKKFGVRLILFHGVNHLGWDISSQARGIPD